MKRYAKESPRLSVKFFDGDTKEQLFEIKDRNWMNIGEMFADHHVDLLIKQTIKEENLPSNVIVVASGDYFLI